MKLRTDLYSAQESRWPQTGRHILAQFDEEKVVVYQAFCPQIGQFAAAHGYFGPGFGVGRMSWIKPNFLWMMYRCGWATKKDQEMVLAISIRRHAFDEVLGAAVHSSYVPAVYGASENWRRAVRKSDVRMQWDPDHDPSGNPLPRRAIQLGLRGSVLQKYAREWLLDVEDITEFVREQKTRLDQLGKTALSTPGGKSISIRFNDALFVIVISSLCLTSIFSRIYDLS